MTIWYFYSTENQLLQYIKNILEITDTKYKKREQFG